MLGEVLFFRFQLMQENNRKSKFTQTDLYKKND